MKKYCLLYFLFIFEISAQVKYNHSELEWKTFETENFHIHFYESTEGTAREGAYVAEKIYPYITNLYEYRPKQKTHIIFFDTDDISNGAAYYYDNKILILDLNKLNFRKVEFKKTKSDRTFVSVKPN